VQFDFGLAARGAGIVVQTRAFIVAGWFREYAAVAATTAGKGNDALIRAPD
jgi:hypothetical protein